MIDVGILVFGLVFLLLAGVVGIALVGVAVTVVLHLLRGLLELVMTVLPAVCWSIGVGVATLLHFGSSDEAGPYGLLAGVLAFPVASYLISKRRKRRSAELRIASAMAPIPAPETAVRRPVDPIAAAWWEAERAAPAEARRIAAARRGCDAVLDQAVSRPLDWALTDCAAMIRSNLPDLVQSAVEAQAEGETNVAAGLVEGLEDMAAEARQCLGTTGSARQRFAILRTHLANRRRAAGA
jgi:hypothetical protein